MAGYRVPRPPWLDDRLLDAVQAAYEEGIVSPACHDLAASLGVPIERVRKARSYLVKTGRMARVRNGVPADEAGDPPAPSLAEIRRRARAIRREWPAWRLAKTLPAIYPDPRPMI